MTLRGQRGDLNFAALASLDWQSDQFIVCRRRVLFPHNSFPILFRCQAPTIETYWYLTRFYHCEAPRWLMAPSSPLYAALVTYDPVLTILRGRGDLWPCFHQMWGALLTYDSKFTTVRCRGELWTLVHNYVVPWWLMTLCSQFWGAVVTYDPMFTAVRRWGDRVIGEIRW